MTLTISIPQKMTRAEWLQNRKTGIGGSEIAAILGVHPFKTPLDVYADKLGLLPELEDNPAMEWGRRLEEPVAEAYGQLKHVNLTHGVFMRHPKLAHIVGTPDRYALDSDFNSTMLVEIKTAGWRQAQRWSDERVPDEYFLQCQHYMLLTGLPVCDLAVLIGGSDFRIHTLEADVDLHGMIVESVEKFWRDHVEAQVPPPPRAADAETLKAMYPTHVSDLMLPAPEEVVKFWPSYLELRKQVKDIESNCDEYEAAIKAAIGSASGLTFPDGSACTWKASKPSLVTDWKGIVVTLNPDKSIVDQFSSMKPGSRRFLTKEPKNV